MYCRNCSNEVSPQAIACPKCGVPPLKGKNFCNSCGTQTHPDAIICVHCGVSLQKPIAMPMNINISIDKRTLLSRWSKLSYSNYVLILLISLMPFVNFKCQNEKVYKLTGLNLAVGKERKYTETKDYGIYGTHDWERKETIFSLDICLFYIVTFICLGLLISKFRKKFKYTRNLTIVSLVILVEWFVFTNIKISNTDLGLIEVSFGAGYWLTLIVSVITLVLLTYYLREFKEHEPVQQPVFTEPSPQTIINEAVPSINQYEATQPNEEFLEYPPTSNKTKYIIGGLIGVILVLGVLFLLQREKVVVASANTSENSIGQTQEQVQGKEPTNSNAHVETNSQNAIIDNSFSSNNSYKLSAFLVYADGTTSDFDLIDNNQISLWNTIIGEGSAGKPSEKTKIVVEGQNGDINLVVYQKKAIVLNKTFSLIGKKEFIINGTGCQPLDIQIFQNANVILTKTINYECGE